MKKAEGRRSKNIEDRRPGKLHLRMKVYGNESPEQEAVRKEISKKMDERFQPAQEQDKARAKAKHPPKGT